MYVLVGGELGIEVGEDCRRTTTVRHRRGVQVHHLHEKRGEEGGRGEYTREELTLGKIMSSTLYMGLGEVWIIEMTLYIECAFWGSEM